MREIIIIIISIVIIIIFILVSDNNDINTYNDNVNDILLKAIATYLYSRPYCIYLAKEKEKIGKLYIFCQIFMQYPMKA